MNERQEEEYKEGRTQDRGGEDDCYACLCLFGSKKEEREERKAVREK